MSSEHPRFRVFVSHAGEDKFTVAIPLRTMLHKHGISAFVDEKDIRYGQDAAKEMVHAMETAHVGVVILSPEYVSRKWPMRELLCFLKRCEKNISLEGFPVVLPVFYRLSIADLYHEPRLDRKNASGQSIYRASRFYERMDDGEPEADISTIKEALRTLHGIMGVRNDLEATNDGSITMMSRRKVMLEQVCDAVLEITCAGRPQQSTALPQSRFEENVFRPFFHVEYNMADLVLEYDRRGDDGCAFNLETRLLDAILDPSPDADRVISIHGIAGVGKTTILRGLSCLDKVRQHFEHGLHFLHLGADADLFSVTEQLSLAVEQSNGKSIAGKMRQEQNWRLMMKGFREWFANKQCLFLIDDIWEVGDISSHVVCELLTLHASGEDSKLLYTTRSPAVACRGRCFGLKPRDPYSPECCDILTRHAGIELEESNTEDKKAVDYILNMGGGLPLFLAVAGKAIRALNIRAGAQGCSAYQVYASTCNENFHSLLHTDVDSYERLEATLSLSVDILRERTEHEKFGFSLFLSVSAMHRRLCVLERHARVPMELLRHVWELHNESQAAIVAREFEQFGLVEMEMERRDHAFAEVLVLHDSLHLFAVQEAKRHERVEECHQSLLSRYSSCGPDLRIDEGKEIRWWSERLRPDGYIHANLCRHMKEARQIVELAELLQRPEWMQRQIEVNDIFKLEEDFVTGIQALEASDEESQKAKRAVLEHVREALVLSSGFIAQNPEEFRFQMYGRLVGHENRSDDIHIITNRLRSSASSQWARSMNRFLQAPGGLTKRTIPLSFRPACITAFEEKKYVAIGYLDGTIAIVNIVRGTVERKWLAHEQGLTALTSDQNGCKLVSGCEGGSMKVWDTESWTCELIFDGHQPYEISAIAIANSGRKLVSVSGCVTVCSVSIETGDLMGRVCTIDKDLLRCCVIFPDGERIAIAQEVPTSRDRGQVRLQVWNMQSASKVGNDFNGECQDLLCLQVTQDQRLIVGGCYTGLIRIWSVEDQKDIAELQPREPGTGIPVSKIALNQNGNRIVAKYGDHQIGVWDRKESSANSAYCRVHTFEDYGSSFVEIGLLDRGNTIVSCSKDGHLQMWTLPRGGETYDVARRDHYTKVVFTPDGERVAVGMSTGTLEIWEVSSCSRIRTMRTCWPMDGDVTSLAIRPDGRVLACIHVFGDADKNVGISLWDMKTGAKLWEVRFEGLDFLVIPWYIATAEMEFVLTGFEGDNSVEVWELASGVPVHWTIVGHMKPIRTVFFTDDLLRIVSVAYRNTNDKQGEIFVSSIQNRTVVRQTLFNVEEVPSDRQSIFELAGEPMNAARGSAAAQGGAASFNGSKGQILKLSDTGELEGVLGTMESRIVDIAFSPDKQTLCAALQNDKLAFVRLETPNG